MRGRGVSLTLLLVVASGCFREPEPNGMKCSTHGCPAGYTCVTPPKGICVRIADAETPPDSPGTGPSDAPLGIDEVRPQTKEAGTETHDSAILIDIRIIDASWDRDVSGEIDALPSPRDGRPFGPDVKGEIPDATDTSIAMGGTDGGSGSGGAPGAGGMSMGGGGVRGNGGSIGTGGSAVSTSSMSSGGATGGGGNSTGGAINGGTSGSLGSGGTSGSGGLASNGGILGQGGLAVTGGSAANIGGLGSGGIPGSGGLGTGGTPSQGGSAGTGGVSQGGGGGNSGSGSGGVSAPGSTNPPMTGGSTGFASRYWSCCKPSCAWTTSVPSCEKDGSTRITSPNATNACDSGGKAFACYDLSPWYDPATNVSYGFAAHDGVPCGTCFMLQFTGEGNAGANAGAAALTGQQMIIQTIDTNGTATTQFDLLIPGGGVGFASACAAQWGPSVDLGMQFGGLLAECSGDSTCMKSMCLSAFGGIPTLLAGCNWFTGWFNSADMPKVIYKQVGCPAQITSKSGIGQ